MHVQLPVLRAVNEKPSEMMASLTVHRTIHLGHTACWLSNRNRVFSVRHKQRVECTTHLV